MNQEMPNEDLRREMQPYGINLSRGPSYLDTDMGGFGPPALVPQKSSNDFLFQSPKPYQSMKEDEVSGFYNIEPYNTGEDKVLI